MQFSKFAREIFLYSFCISIFVHFVSLVYWNFLFVNTSEVEFPNYVHARYLSRNLWSKCFVYFISKRVSPEFSGWCIISKYKWSFCAKWQTSSIEIFEKTSFLCKMTGKFHVFCFEKGSFLCKITGKFHVFCFGKGFFLCKVAGKFHEGSF